MRTRSKATSSSSAAICASAVLMPCPSSTLPLAIHTVRSRSNRIRGFFTPAFPSLPEAPRGPRGASGSEGNAGVKNPRIRFERDRTVWIASGKVELGQGINTALAQIAAEELDVAFERVRIVPPSTAHSPDEGYTSGSMSVQEGGRGIREACVQ